MTIPSLTPLLTGDGADPYLYYRQLRFEDPIHWSEPLQAWLFSRYTDVTAALKDSRFSTTQRWTQVLVSLQQMGVNARELKGLIQKTLHFSDPASHKRLRALATKGLALSVLVANQRKTEAIVGTWFENVPTRTRYDLHNDIAKPLNLVLSAHMLEIAVEELQRILPWFDCLRLAVHAVVKTSMDWHRVEQATQELMNYFRKVVERHQAMPGVDIVSALIDSAKNRFTTDELAALCIQMLDGRLRSMPHWVCSSMLALLEHEDQWQSVQRAPTLGPVAIEELLRYAGVPQGVTRIALEDFEIGRRQIRKGQKVVLLLAAANRDPEEFAEPERLNLNRRPNRHVALGFGPHVCLGAPIIRAEAPIIFRALVHYLPGLRLDDRQSREWAGGLAGRHLSRLPVMV
jgi:cytochrome P450